MRGCFLFRGRRSTDIGLRLQGTVNREPDIARPLSQQEKQRLDFLRMVIANFDVLLYFASVLLWSFLTSEVKAPMNQSRTQQRRQASLQRDETPHKTAVPSDPTTEAHRCHHFESPLPHSRARPYDSLFSRFLDRLRSLSHQKQECEARFLSSIAYS